MIVISLGRLPQLVPSITAFVVEVPVIDIDKSEGWILLNDVQSSFVLLLAAVPPGDGNVRLAQIRVHVMNGRVEQTRRRPIEAVRSVLTQMGSEGGIVCRLLNVVGGSMLKRHSRTCKNLPRSGSNEFFRIHEIHGRHSKIKVARSKDAAEL
jgi:hypothetical protein